MQIAGERPGQSKAGERPGQTKVDERPGQTEAGERPGQSKAGERSSSAETLSTSKSITSLEAMGVRVFGLDEPLVGNANEEVTWDTIAGYDQQKREMEDTVLLALRSPEVYDDIARGTR
ncbi:uncharacterized protein LOC110689160 [Chenopodium quinoa]|nr:uncharacterized protein LOC110689160 [Chenopodium quinoa]